MSDARSLLLTSGKLVLADVLARGTRARIAGARVGTTPNFLPTEDGVSPTPSVAFNLPPNNIIAKIINQNQVRFTLTFTEDMGDFDIGNIILDINDNGISRPFIWWASDVAIPKLHYTSEIVGNRLAISFIEEFVNFADAISMTVTSPTYSSLPTYTNELVLPDPETILYNQFVIQQHTDLYQPALGMRRAADNRFYGFPFLSRIDHPNFGTLGGGASGDNYRPYTGDIYWGGRYLTPDNEYVGDTNVATYLDTFFDDELIGDSYTTT